MTSASGERGDSPFFGNCLPCPTHNQLSRAGPRWPLWHNVALPTLGLSCPDGGTMAQSGLVLLTGGLQQHVNLFTLPQGQEERKQIRQDAALCILVLAFSWRIFWTLITKPPLPSCFVCSRVLGYMPSKSCGKYSRDITHPVRTQSPSPTRWGLLCQPDRADRSSPGPSRGRRQLGGRRPSSCPRPPVSRRPALSAAGPCIRSYGGEAHADPDCGCSELWGLSDRDSLKPDTHTRDSRMVAAPVPYPVPRQAWLRWLSCPKALV